MHNKLLVDGATSIGKGFTFKKLRSVFGATIEAVGTGELVRQRLDSDIVFRKKFESQVDEGELIPDETIIPMGLERWKLVTEMSLVERVYLDGFPRNTSQFDFLLRNGLISREDTLIVFLHASRGVCRTRFVHRNLAKPDGERSDGKSFERRFDIHRHDQSLLLKKVQREKFRLIHIDANRPLEEFATDVLAASVAFWGNVEQVQATPPQALHPGFVPTANIGSTRLRAIRDSRAAMLASV